MKFLVTGAGGMIGANLAWRLQKQGHEVHALDHFSVGHRDNLKGFPGVVHMGDIRTFDYASLGRLDGIFHQAAITDTTVMDEALMLSVNVEAFQKILDYALASGCPKVVYASSAATYGKGGVPMREDQPPAPANIYGVSKVKMDEAARAFAAKRPEVSVVGLRYFNVYGPLEFHKKSAASMIYQLYKQIAAGRAPRVFKWGEQFRDFIYAKDVVEANWKAFEFKGSGIFNVGTGIPTTFNQVIAILNQRLGASKPTDFFDNPYGFYQEATQADTALAKNTMGFAAAYPPEKGIADYVAYLREREAAPARAN
jgi:ADP-L-glycero-D-manno-heptose 6-epimerase